MTVKRMDNVGIVVESLDSAISFFSELGLPERSGKRSWLPTRDVCCGRHRRDARQAAYARRAARR